MADELDELDDYLFDLDMPYVPMHTDRMQIEREGALRGFRSG